MPKLGEIKDRAGERFGRLVVVRCVGRDKSGDALWYCRCDCGNTVNVRGDSLQQGNTKSCGCLRGGQPLVKEELLLSRVEKTDGCWNWTGATTSAGGYGSLIVGGRRVGAHRFSYEMYRGAIPDGMCVLHHCDNPPCVNPDHLFLGSRKDNLYDMIQKGRKVNWPMPGESNPSAKLTPAEVLAIRKTYEDGQRQTDIAIQYGVSTGTIWAIVHRKKWVHLKEA